MAMLSKLQLPNVKGLLLLRRLPTVKVVYRFNGHIAFNSALLLQPTYEYACFLSCSAAKTAPRP